MMQLWIHVPNLVSAESRKINIKQDAMRVGMFYPIQQHEERDEGSFVCAFILKALNSSLPSSACMINERQSNYWPQVSTLLATGIDCLPRVK